MAFSSASLKILLIMGLLCYSTADFPIRISSAPSERDMCVNESKIIKDGQEIIKSRVAPLVNKEYGPPCICGEEDGHWKRAIYLNVEEKRFANANGWRGCSQTEGIVSCKSIHQNQTNDMYTKVCGMIRASYKASSQKDTTFAFENYLLRAQSKVSGQSAINSAYLDGVSVTYGNSPNRSHVWSFVVPQNQNNGMYKPQKNCLCSNNDSYWPFIVPDFIENNSFCDSNKKRETTLWSGEDCSQSSTCCRDVDHPSWFCTTLAGSVQDKLEVRYFGDTIDISLIEIYIA